MYPFHSSGGTIKIFQCLTCLTLDVELYYNNTSLTFIGPCIVIYFYSETNEIPHFLKFNLFCCKSLHVLGGLSIHLVPAGKQSAESI
jgi:hypothetical protein